MFRMSSGRNASKWRRKRKVVSAQSPITPFEIVSSAWKSVNSRAPSDRSRRPSRSGPLAASRSRTPTCT
ncbi:unnamed protein product, partial [Iphiclides podalirius]